MLSFDCIWEWLNGWNDYPDLPALRSIHLGDLAMKGDGRDGRGIFSKSSKDWTSTLVMKSSSVWNDEWIDLPSLASFKGEYDNFRFMDSVILESSDMTMDWCRYPSTVRRWNPIQETVLLLYLFPSILEYSFSHLLITWCSCSWVSHQK